jgi:hypothetical protein
MLLGLVLVERVRGKVMQFPFNKLYTLYKLLTFNF